MLTYTMQKRWVSYGMAILVMLFFMTSAKALEVGSRRDVYELVSQTEYLDRHVLEKALTAFQTAQNAGITQSPYFTIIDYSKPSNEPRMWVFNLEDKTLIYEELVSHGKNSGLIYAKKFSNEPDSRQSSLGLFRTGEPYYGSNGYSLRLDGLEEDINDRARERGIVIHGAPYVSFEHVAEQGRLGRSHGCPVVSHQINRKLIDTIKGGSLVFAYYPERSWLSKSEFLKGEVKSWWAKIIDTIIVSHEANQASPGQS